MAEKNNEHIVKIPELHKQWMETERFDWLNINNGKRKQYLVERYLKQKECWNKLFESAITLSAIVNISNKTKHSSEYLELSRKEYTQDENRVRKNWNDFLGLLNKLPDEKLKRFSFTFKEEVTREELLEFEQFINKAVTVKSILTQADVKSKFSHGLISFLKKEGYMNIVYKILQYEIQYKSAEDEICFFYHKLLELLSNTHANQYLNFYRPFNDNTLHDLIKLVLSIKRINDATRGEIQSIRKEFDKEKIAYQKQGDNDADSIIVYFANNQLYDDSKNESNSYLVNTNIFLEALHYLWPDTFFLINGKTSSNGALLLNKKIKLDDVICVETFDDYQNKFKEHISAKYYDNSTYQKIYEAEGGNKLFLEYKASWNNLKYSDEKIKKILEKIELDQFFQYVTENKINFWTFKHKPGTGTGEVDCLPFIQRAINNNYCLMQYEFGRQENRMVTQNWSKALSINEGDIIFLRGDKKIYAFGKVCLPRKNADENLVIESNSQLKQIIDKNKLYSEDGIDNGVIHINFNDEYQVFYLDFTDEKEENWGQRIDVGKWEYPITEGIDVQSNDYYDDNDNYLVIRNVKEKNARKWLKLLEEQWSLKNKEVAMSKELLLANYNLILTGAPGTGKTYLARQIAEALTESRNEIEFVQFHPSYDYTDFVEGLRPIKGKENDIGFKLKNGIFKEFCKKAKANDKNYVFIIDEINRGEISKIFGELFFSIDPGYRGEKGKVKTQYANMQTEETCFADINDDYFYVPKNVYIIGTMNDIDRSVESFDFAMRRRFVWKEINAKDTQNMLDAPEYAEKVKVDVDIIKTRMNNLNIIISKTEELGPHYNIGAAYFLKLAEYKGDFDKLWELHLEPLLREYLRGMQGAETMLGALRKAYDSYEG